jgi:hypothetical protein
MATTSRLPGGFTRVTMTFAMVLLVALVAFTVGALANDSRYALVALAVSIPILFAIAPRGAPRRLTRTARRSGES